LENTTKWEKCKGYFEDMQSYWRGWAMAGKLLLTNNRSVIGSRFLLLTV